MYTQVKTVNATQLNSGSAFAFNVKHNVINLVSQNRYYNAHSLKVKNTSGAILYFLPVTEAEYIKWQTIPTVTDLIPLAIDEEMIIDELKGTIDKMIVKGTSGHNATLDFLILQRSI